MKHMKNKEATLKYVNWLLESAISSVLLEQVEQQLAPVAPAEPDPAAPTQEAQPKADSNAQQQPTRPTMSLDELIEKLNLIRGGRSFTNPEVYTKMGEVFKTFTDQQKADLDFSLEKIIQVIVNPDEQQQPDQASQVSQSTTPQTSPTPPTPTSQAGTPSSSPIT